PLVDWRAKGHQLAYLGTEDIDGTPAHKLRVRLKDGDTEYHYVDPDAFLVIRVVKESKVRGVERITETDYSDYEEIAGVWMPLSFESGPKGAPANTHIQYERAEPNVDLPDTLSRFPAPGEKIGQAIVAAPGAAPPRASSGKAPATGAPVFENGVISG